jgi:hypothetical protein
MKKLLLALPVILLVAAGCNSSSTSQPTSQTQPTLQTQTAPTQQQVAQAPTPSPTQTTQPIPTPTTTNNSITDKTYTSNYGYQFTYSSKYSLDTTNTKKVGLYNKPNITDSSGNKVPPDISIENFDNLTQLPHYQASIKNSDDYLTQSGSAKLMYNITSYTNKNGNLVYSFTDAGLKAVYTELIAHNNHYYQISFSQRETGDQLTKSEQQIQTTFKFTK